MGKHGDIFVNINLSDYPMGMGMETRREPQVPPVYVWMWGTRGLGWVGGLIGMAGIGHHTRCMPGLEG